MSNQKLPKTTKLVESSEEDNIVEWINCDISYTGFEQIVGGPLGMEEEKWQKQ